MASSQAPHFRGIFPEVSAMTQATTVSSITLTDTIRADAKAARARGETAHVPVADMEAAALRIIALPTDDPAAAAALAKRGVGADYFKMIATFHGELVAARSGMPQNLSKVPVLADTDRDTVAAARAHLRDLRTSAGDVAESQGNTAAARAFGRGSKFGSSADGVRRAGADFIVACTDERKPLLTLAGITTDDIKKLADFLPKLEAIAAAKDGRKSKRTVAARDSELAELTLAKAFVIFRARARLAFAGDPATLATVLGRLPRRADRRHAVPTVAPVAAAEASENK
jgi:hypothetical protein